MLPVLIGLLNYSFVALMNAFKREYTQKGVHPWVTVGVPLVLSHPVILLFFWLTNQFTLPPPAFFLAFFFVVLAGLGSSYFRMKAYVSSQFAAVSTIISSGVLVTTVLATVLLGEVISGYGWASIILSFIGLMLITFPHRPKWRHVRWDKGLVLAFTGMMFGAVGSVLYRRVALLSPDAASFFVGRSIADLVFWSLVMLLLVPLLTKQGPNHHLLKFFGQGLTGRYVPAMAALWLVDAYIIFLLPASTRALLQTVIIPVAFLLGWDRYHERPPRRVYVGSLVVFFAIILFIVTGNI